MTIKTTIGLIGTDGVLPQFVFINTTDSSADVIEPGYLNSQLSLGYQFTNDQIAFITCSDATLALQVSVEGSNVDLIPFSAGEVTSVFSRIGNITAQAGDYNTSQVNESGNLYFTQPRVLATTLTGLSIFNSPITSADSVLVALGKAQGQIDELVSGEVTSVFGRTGDVVALAGDYTADKVTNAADKASVSAQVFSAELRSPSVLFGTAPNELLNLRTDGTLIYGLNADTATPLTKFNIRGDLSVITSADQPQIIFTNEDGVINGNVGIFACSGSLDGPVFQGFNYLTSTPNNTYVGGFGGNVGLGSTTGSLAADFPIHIHGQTCIGTFDGNATQLILKEENTPLQSMQMGFDPVNSVSFIQSFTDSSSITPGKLLINPETDGSYNVGIGYPLNHTFQSILDLKGDLFLPSIATPSMPTIDGGKFYSKDVSGVRKAFYLNDAGTEFDLTASGTTYTASNGVKLVGSDFQFDDTYSPTFNNLTLDGTSLTATNANFSLTGGTQVNVIANTLIQLSSSSQISLSANSGAGSINLQGMTSVFNTLVMADAPILVTNGGTQVLKLDWDNVNSKMILDAYDSVGSAGPLYINPTGGFLGAGIPATATLQSPLSVNGDIFLKETTTPSTPTQGIKLYGKSDGFAYYKNAAGTERQLPGTGSSAFNIVTVSSSTYTSDGTEDELVVDANGTAIAITINTALLVKELRIYKKNTVLGSLNITITPDSGQTINGSSSPVTIFSNNARYSYVRLVPSDVSTNAYLADISIAVPDQNSGLDKRSSGIVYQFGNGTIAGPIAALASASVTIGLPDSYSSSTSFNAIPSTNESTSGVPLSVKVTSQTANSVTVQLTNLHAVTSTTTDVKVSVWCVGV